MSRTYTAKEVVEALRKNGLPKIQGHFFQYPEGARDRRLMGENPIGACSMGQIYINLDIPETSEVMNMVIADEIVRLNDYTNLSFAEIADNIEARNDYDPTEIWVEVLG